ncbi:MAG: DJ-1/PfpI family protein [Gammaproteobacteria bacterium]|jgi:4-methyl-5(b-hydroxyethyl)-thiazole monophosphate biosynthesis
MAKVLVPLANGCEELEAVTIIDLLRRAGIEVITAGLDASASAVRASRGTVLVPDASLEQAMQQDYDMVALPGGQPGTDNLNADRRIHALLERMARHENYIAAICAAPKVLASAGLLKGRRVTSFPGALSQAQLAEVHYEESAVVQDGNIFTSRGPGTAMDFALSLVACLAGKAKRDEVEQGLARPAR